MSTSYHIYQNDGLGGPVDYGTIVATVAGLTWTSGALAAPSDTTFAIRAFDTGSGLEDRNTDARVRIVIDAAGNDITGLPNAPASVHVEVLAAGAARVLWTYNPGNQGGAPTGFHVYVGTPTPDYGTVAATTPYARGRGAFRASLTGLTDGVVYQAAVRAYNATGEEANAAVIAFTASSTGPNPVDDLAAAAAF